MCMVYICVTQYNFVDFSLPLSLSLSPLRGQDKGGMTSSWNRTPSFGAQTPMVGSMTPSYGSMTPLPGAGGRTPMYGSQTPQHGDGERREGEEEGGRKKIRK